MHFDELLEHYKASPRRESAALLLSDNQLLKYCVVFKQLRPRRLHEWPLEDDWESLWRCVDVDMEQLAMLADDMPGVALRFFERIKGLRLVYPDGTAQALVDQLILKRLTDGLSE